MGGKCGEDHIPPTRKKALSFFFWELLSAGKGLGEPSNPTFAWKWRVLHPKGKRGEGRGEGKGLWDRFFPFPLKQKEKPTQLGKGRRFKHLALARVEKKSRWEDSKGFWMTRLSGPTCHYPPSQSPVFPSSALPWLLVMLAFDCLLPQAKGGSNSRHPWAAQALLSGVCWEICTILQTIHWVGTQSSQPLAFRQLISLVLLWRASCLISSLWSCL